MGKKGLLEKCHVGLTFLSLFDFCGRKKLCLWYRFMGPSRWMYKLLC